MVAAFGSEKDEQSALHYILIVMCFRTTPYIYIYMESYYIGQFFYVDRPIRDYNLFCLLISDTVSVCMFHILFYCVYVLSDLKKNLYP